MRTSVFALAMLLLVYRGNAQNELRKCGEKLNAEILRVIAEGKGKDTNALKEVNRLRKEWEECVVGKDMPYFSAKSIKGKTVKAEEVIGKIVVINFWFTTCLPCVAKMPAFNRLVEEYKKDSVEFIGFAFTEKKKVKAFLRKTPFNVKIIPDSRLIEEEFGIVEHPVTFIIDSKGKIRKVWSGGNIGEKAADEAYGKIKPVLNKLAEEYRTEP